MIEHEQRYLYEKDFFYNIPFVSTVSTVINDIAKYFYDKKLVEEKVGNIYPILLENDCSICPICGGHADTLDHVLPKNLYTQYTITPINLIPMCSRCNRIKSSSLSSGNPGETVFHPYFNDYHDLTGLSIKYKINSQNNFIPIYYFDSSAKKELIYNFKTVFKLGEVLSSLASSEILKISEIIIEKNNLTNDLKPFALLFIQKRKDNLICNMDEIWEFLLYDLLIEKFDIFYEHAILNKLNKD